MAYVPTTFVDRSVEFPNRRKLTAVSGLADTFDVARAEGTVFAEGTKPDAANLNAEFGKIKTETDAINSSLGSCEFSVGTDGAYITYTPTGGADPVSKKLGSGAKFLSFLFQVSNSGNYGMFAGSVIMCFDVADCSTVTFGDISWSASNTQYGNNNYYRYSIDGGSSWVYAIANSTIDISNVTDFRLMASAGSWSISGKESLIELAYTDVTFV